jgi:hypothetical protein
MNSEAIVNKCILLLLFLIVGMSACSGISTSSSSPLNLPSTSPAKVVEDYLAALKQQNFLKTYEFISFGYAGNLDKESYKINMEKGPLKKYSWSLLNYQITGVRIIGDQAYVSSELGVQFKPLNSESKIQKTIEVQYVLAPLENKWRITSDYCVSNCSAEDLVGKTTNKPIDSN